MIHAVMNGGRHWPVKEGYLQRTEFVRKQDFGSYILPEGTELEEVGKEIFEANSHCNNLII